MYFNYYSVPLLFVVIINFLIIALVKKYLEKPGAKYFIYLVCCVSIYTFFYALEISSTTIETTLFFYKLQYFGISLIPAFVLMFAFDYTGKLSLIPPNYVKSIFIIPLLTMLIVFTNEWHHLFHHSAHFETSLFYQYLNFSPGFWYWIQQSYAILSLIVAMLLLGNMWYYSAPAFRKQVLYIFVGFSIPYMTYILYIFGYFSKGLDPNPYVFFISAIIIYTGFIRKKIFNVMPLARTMLFDLLPDPVLVLDPEMRIVDRNFSARNIFGVTSGDLGKPVTEIMPYWPELNCKEPKLTSFDVSGEFDDTILFFNITIHPIQEKKNVLLGYMFFFKDVTEERFHEAEKKMAEEEKARYMNTLEASEKKYREISRMLRLMNDNVQDMIWAKDLNKNYIFANKALCNNLLISDNTDEPIGKNDLFFAQREQERHSENPDWHTFGKICRDSDQMVMDSKKAQRFDETGNVKGKFLFLDVYKAPLLDESGVMIGTVGSARDVTRERKLFEENLSISESLKEKTLRLQATLQSLPDLVFVVNHEGMFTDYYAQSDSDLLIPRERIIGASIFDVFSEKQATDQLEYYKKCLKSGSIEVFTYDIKIKESVRYYEARISKLDDSHVLAIVRDITIPSRLQQDLKLSEERHRLLAENASDIIGLYGDDFKHRYISPSFEKVTGYPHHYLDHNSYFDLIYPEDRETFFSLLEKSNEERSRSTTYTYRITHKSGRIVWMESICNRIYDSENKLKQIMVISRDITRRKNDEDKIRNNLKEKELLLKEIHHRVKNNLNVISSLLNLQARKITGKEDALEAFRNSSDRVMSMALVHQKLYQSEHFDEINIKYYIQSLTNQLIGIFKIGSNIKIVTNVKKIILNINIAVPVGLILNELITNALKHAFPNNATGDINILITKSTDKYFSLTISDNGIGLPDEIDIKNSDTLGLHLVDVLVRQLKGKWHVNRQNGTQISICFPLM